MRKLLFILFLIPAFAFAQAPKLLSYQSVIRDANNNLLVNKDVTVRISILAGSAGGPVVFQEFHLVTTNQNGLAYLTIGKGIASIATIDSVKWDKDNYFIKSDTDPNGGNDFKISVTSQILSAPFALHSRTAEKLTGEYAEKDPLFNASVAKSITSADTASWKQKLDSKDTLGLSTRINTKLNLVDTTAMLQPYLKKTDTVSVSNRINAKLNTVDTTTMLQPYLKKVDTVSLSNRINARLSIVDTTAMLQPYLKKSDTVSVSNRINTKLNLVDTTSMLQPYLKKVDTVSLSNRINARLSIVDTTAMLQPYLKKTDTVSVSNRINTKLSIVDTTAMLQPYLKEVDTLSLSNRINTKLNITDTTTVLQPYLKKVDTLSLSNRINQVGLPQTGNTPGSILVWDGSTWLRLAAGSPGQVLYVGSSGFPLWGNLSTETITTGIPASITNVSAQVAGVISGSNLAIVESGVAYGTTPNPTVSGSKVLATGNLANFTVTLPGLTPGTNYYARAYWIGPLGITYGGQQTFTTNITSINCASAVLTGNLTAGVAASGVSVAIPFVGNGGGTHSGQTVSSTGITGLTATLTAGTFTGANLTYAITGTPSGSGNANFAINIGGQTCTLTVAVSAGALTTLNCASPTNNGTLTAGLAASGVSTVIGYTGGNGGTHGGQVATSTGVTGLTATLVAGSFASGAGSLTYTITGTPASTGTASFAINIGGQTCTITRTVNEGTINGITCNTASTGTLVAGAAATGVTFTNSYTSGNGGKFNGRTVPSNGVSGLTATLPGGTLKNGDSTLVYTISGTPATTGTATFLIEIGGQSCVVNLTVVAGSVSSLDNCGTVTLTNGPLTIGSSAIGKSFTINYSGGNGGSHTGQVVGATGVTGGLTAVLSAGNFANGSGSLVYTLSGTPTSTGTASFAINIGGRTCTVSFTVNP